MMRSLIRCASLVVLGLLLAAPCPAEPGSPPAAEEPPATAAPPTHIPGRITRGTRYQRVEAPVPPRLSLEPMDAHPLVRGELMTFRLLLSGAPKPITMFSARISYTTGTLELDSFRQAPAYIVDVTPAIPVGEEHAAHNIGGISLTGVTDGELARLTFRVPASAPERVSISIEDHPLLREGLAHDEGEFLYDYARVLDASAVSALVVVDELPEGVTREGAGANPRRRIPLRDSEE